MKAPIIKAWFAVFAVLTFLLLVGCGDSPAGVEQPMPEGVVVSLELTEFENCFTTIVLSVEGGAVGDYVNFGAVVMDFTFPDGTVDQLNLNTNQLFNFLGLARLHTGHQYERSAFLLKPSEVVPGMTVAFSIKYKTSAGISGVVTAQRTC